MNIVILHGRLTADPEMRTANSGTEIAGFTVAVDGMKDKDGNKQTDFIRCTAFGKTAQMLSRYWTKGKEIALEGALRQNDYEKDGVKHHSYQVIANRVHFCGGKNDSAQTGTEQTAPAQTDSIEQFAQAVEAVDEQSVPF